VYRRVSITIESPRDQGTRYLNHLPNDIRWVDDGDSIDISRTVVPIYLEDVSGLV